MTWGFESNNVVFIPEGGRLAIADVYAWRRTVVDVRHSTVRMRPEAVTRLEAEAERIAKDLEKRRDASRESVAEARVALRRFVADAKANQAARIAAKPASAPVGGAEAKWWVRLTDGPAESFFAEDYEEADDPPATGVFRRLYGSCVVGTEEPADIPFPAEGDAAAFEWILPDATSSVDEPLPVEEPLPLVHEFCGADGVSSRGNAVNVTVRGEIAGTHSVCCPLRTIGEGIMATLYFSRPTKVAHRVLSLAGPLAIGRAREILGRSSFAEAVSGPNWSVHRRDGDVVHLYTDLEGKESAGFDRIPGLIVVASAGGGFEPAAREAILRSIVDAMR